MAGFQCPFCQMIMPITLSTQVCRYPSFDRVDDSAGSYFDDSTLNVEFYKCPNCGEYTVSVIGVGPQIKDVHVTIRPKSLAKQFPDYIPQAIREDYEEAYSILNLSPKASATLARRCLQGMIRDFWEINESNLAKSIEKLEGKIPSDQWKVIDGVRRIGNIGAHMEKDMNLIVDIEPNEAEKLLMLIELLIQQWYINRHEQEQLYADIIAIDADKQEQRKKTE